MSAQSRRVLIDGLGSQIKRNETVQFTFDGKTLSGYKGDTLASALLANDVTLMGRSFKYHRPRGLLSTGSEEPNAIVELRSGARREPNTRATMIELFDGLEATSQNRFPSLKFDLMSVNQLISPFLTAGFYYKTFMWPASFWETVYEKIIRRSAGLGRAALESDPDHYEHSHLHCDVLVVGGGPAGIGAARAAAATGVRVVLAEEMPVFGGDLCHALDKIDGAPAERWVSDAIAELENLDNVDVMPRTTVFGYYDDNVLAALERVNDHVAIPAAHQPRQRLWTMRAKQVVIAAGTHERPMIFANNDKPGIMLVSAVQRLLDRYAVAPGQKIVICTAHDDAYRTATLLQQAGVQIAAITDARTTLTAAALEAKENGLLVYSAHVPSKAKGGQRVTGLSICTLDGSTPQTISCDCIAMSAGYSPDVHLSSQTGASPVWDNTLQAFLPAKPIREERSAGACAGIYSLSDCLASGHEAGLAAAKVSGGSDTKILAATAANTDANSFADIGQCPGDGKSFIDFQNDVSAQDIRLAYQEGYVSVEHTKRYTTLGMATDQGKTANVNGIAILAQARGQSIEEVGTTRFRPPYSPVAIGAFAGHERGKAFQPLRRTAMHDCHVKLGAVFVEAGQWVRPQYYPLPGEDVMASIYRESEQVRKSVGLCDVSTLGKIELFGSDAAEFLNRLYINGWDTLAIGKARYGLMLREDGYVFDDGTTSRLGEHHYFMTTTTANAARVLAHMEHAAQVLWPDLDVYFCSATEQWCGVALAGPRARETLQDAVGDALRVVDAELPFMGVHEFDWNGVQARVFRISFSGEHAYEINVPWGHGEAMWNTLFSAGEQYGLIPYGTEALSVLRIEKGHVAGNELDGRTTAADMGLGRMMSSKKHYIGQIMNQREGFQDPQRATLVGVNKLRSAIPCFSMQQGSVFVAEQNTLSRKHMSLHRVSPLESVQIKDATASAPITLSVIYGNAMLQVFAKKNQITQASQRLNIDQQAGMASNADQFVAFPLSPGQWLLSANSGGDGRFFQQIAERLGDAGYVSEQSHSRVVIRVSGSAARALLQKGCRLDLHPNVIKPGFCAQTPIAQIGVLLHQVESSPTYDLYVYSGFADSFWHWLTESAAQYGYNA